jgi:hypothetical protein
MKRGTDWVCVVWCVCRTGLVSTGVITHAHGLQGTEQLPPEQQLLSSVALQGLELDRQAGQHSARTAQPLACR